jgi:hypothetical protein
MPTLNLVTSDQALPQLPAFTKIGTCRDAELRNAVITCPARQLAVRSGAEITGSLPD